MNTETSPRSVCSGLRFLKMQYLFILRAVYRESSYSWNIRSVHSPGQNDSNFPRDSLDFSRGSLGEKSFKGRSSRKLLNVGKSQYTKLESVLKESWGRLARGERLGLSNWAVMELNYTQWCKIRTRVKCFCLIQCCVIVFFNLIFFFQHSVWFEKEMWRHFKAIKMLFFSPIGQ